MVFRQDVIREPGIDANCSLLICVDSRPLAVQEDSENTQIRMTKKGFDRIYRMKKMEEILSECDQEKNRE